MTHNSRRKVPNVRGDSSAHYHKERPHQGLDNNQRIAPTTTSTGLGPIQCRERLGGMLKFTS